MSEHPLDASAPRSKPAPSSQRLTPEQLLDDAAQAFPFAGPRDWVLAHVRAGVPMPDALNAISVVLGTQIGGAVILLKDRDRGGLSFLQRIGEVARKLVMDFGVNEQRRAAEAAAHKAAIDERAREGSR